MKALTALALAAGIFLAAVGVANAGDTIVGGEIKFFLFDQSNGETDVYIVEEETRDDVVESHNNISMGMSSALITLSRDLSDDFTVLFQPEILVHAGATPRLGDDEIVRHEAGAPEIEFLRAHVTWRLPEGFELKAGYLKPLFTWDYGYELFWHEEYHASYVTANPWLGSWHDTGLELYKSFETDEFSVPVYLYLLNGPDGAMSDNNEGKSVMVHAAPEFLSGRVKLLGSYGMGKWDADNKNSFSRYAAGAALSFSGFSVRGEYMGGTWEDKFIVADLATSDVEPSGYYVKAFYNVTPEFKVFAGLSHLEHDFSGFFFTASSLAETYDTTVIGADYVIADGATVMLAYNMVNAEREADETARNSDDYSAMVDYARLTMGLRVTF
jgi:hypothetical protein